MFAVPAHLCERAEHGRLQRVYAWGRTRLLLLEADAHSRVCPPGRAAARRQTWLTLDGISRNARLVVDESDLLSAEPIEE
jgi:hypothetical protein